MFPECMTTRFNYRTSESSLVANTAILTMAFRLSLAFTEAYKGITFGGSFRR
jgi:hypothetical protein